MSEVLAFSGGIHAGRTGKLWWHSFHNLQSARVARGTERRQRNLSGDLGRSCRGRRRQQVVAYFQKLFAVTVGEKSKVADANKALWQNVQEESSQKLARW